MMITFLNKDALPHTMVTPQFRANITNSFRNVKEDIDNLHRRIAQLEHQVNMCTEHLAHLVHQKPTIAEQQYVASKKGKKAYPSHTLHAKNIKPENRIIFTSKDDALTNGYTTL